MTEPTSEQQQELGGPIVPAVLTVLRTPAGLAVLVDGKPFPYAIGPKVEHVIDTQASVRKPDGGVVRAAARLAVELIGYRVETVDAMTIAAGDQGPLPALVQAGDVDTEPKKAPDHAAYEALRARTLAPPASASTERTTTR